MLLYDSHTNYILHDDHASHINSTPPHVKKDEANASHINSTPPHAKKDEATVCYSQRCDAAEGRTSK